ncbi:type II toxin-antitoxin system MqsA family antitoxin [Comamonas thiooxydans]|uniref:type II toxin-antitoxin system MqsA family antitoxin n=1 Tax=Comamonas thiooxydans TaxID=363952 RepID=UPI0009B8E029|nr:type II toxin-antitoxin system MqsA family antitoxin [Comamonas thiooxydans]
MKCPCCYAAELVRDARDLPYSFRGQATVIPAVTGDYCPSCDESVLDADESHRVMNEMRAFRNQVDSVQSK